ncbi:MAG: hypothetical protein P0116_14425 [Candidatus Nitrosocosmicus sp.]|nr:hypothetical protein [Candidatus Nitrosocosmicus sp.]
MKTKIKNQTPIIIEIDAEGDRGQQSKIILKNKASYPSIGLLENIKEYLKSTSSSIVTASNNLHVRNFKYYSVFVSAKIYIKDINLILETRQKCLDSLAKYVDPVTGGSDSKGWTLGKIVYPSDVVKLFFEIKSIIHVNNIVVKIHPDEIDDDNKEIVYLFNQQLDNIDSIKSKNKNDTPGSFLPKDKGDITYCEKNSISNNKSSNLNSHFQGDKVLINQFDDSEYSESLQNQLENTIPKHGMMYDGGSHDLQIEVFDDST